MRPLPFALAALAVAGTAGVALALASPTRRRRTVTAIDLSASPPRVIWFGPVSRAQVAGATVAGVAPAFVQCTGDGSDGRPTCGALADAWQGPAGRLLPQLLEHLHLAPAGKLYLGAFSAGGQCVKRILTSTADRAAVTGVLLSDGTYTTDWFDKAHGTTLPIKGFLLYALDALADGRLFLATASSWPNRDYPNGSQTLAGLVEGIEAASGKKFKDARRDPLWRGLKPPVRAWRLRNVICADFGKAYTHGEQATLLAPILWPRATGGPSKAVVDTAGAPRSSDLASGLLLAAVQAHDYEPSRWVEVPWSAAGVTLLVSADALRAPVDGELVRLPVSWTESQAIDRLLECVPLTAEVSDAIWTASKDQVRVVPHPLGAWPSAALQKSDPAKARAMTAAASAGMRTIEWSRRFSRDLDAQIAGRSGLVADVGKDEILSPRLLHFPGQLVLYGWRYPSGTPIQKTGNVTEKPFHEAAYYDYSQTKRLLRRHTTSGEDVLRVYERMGLPPVLTRSFGLASAG